MLDVLLLCDDYQGLLSYDNVKFYHKLNTKKMIIIKKVKYLIARKKYMIDIF